MGIKRHCAIISRIVFTQFTASNLMVHNLSDCSIATFPLPYRRKLLIGIRASSSLLSPSVVIVVGGSCFIVCMATAVTVIVVMRMGMIMLVVVFCSKLASSCHPGPTVVWLAIAVAIVR